MLLKVLLLLLLLPACSSPCDFEIRYQGERKGFVYYDNTIFGSCTKPVARARTIYGTLWYPCSDAYYPIEKQFCTL